MMLEADQARGQGAKVQVHRRHLFHILGGILGLSALSPSIASAFNDHAKLRIPLLRHKTPYTDPRPGAIRRMLLEAEKQTSIAVDPVTEIIDPLSPQLFTAPMIMLAGEGAFPPWSDAVVDRLRTYLTSGGLLIVDVTEALKDGPFMASVRRELKRIFPQEQLRKLPQEHVIYKSFFLVDKPYGRLFNEPHMDAIFEQDRVSVVINYNDMMGAWARDNFGRWEYDTAPGGEKQRDYAFRLGINLVMYALCVNYKEDQVHIPFILKRRKWRVD